VTAPFDYIEMFYNPVRKQVRNGMLSLVQFEQQQTLNDQGVQKSRAYSDALVDLHAEIDRLRVFEPLRTLAEQRIQMTLKRPWLPDRLHDRQAKMKPPTTGIMCPIYRK
jgi:hypothetical protein